MKYFEVYEAVKTYNKRLLVICKTQFTTSSFLIARVNFKSPIRFPSISIIIFQNGSNVSNLPPFI